MNSINYESKLHLEMITKWYKQWDMPIDDIIMLPPTGLIIPDVCAVFIYKTNSLICLIENLICNQECDLETRQQGLSIITNDILDMAKDCGFKKIISLVSNPKVIERITKLSYTISEEKFHIMIRSFK